MYNAVEVDVSKGKSTIAVLQPRGQFLRKPFDVLHSPILERIVQLPIFFEG